MSRGAVLATGKGRSAHGSAKTSRSR